MNKQIEALAHAYKEVTEKYHSKKKTDEELKGDQHKLDANGNGKIDGDDFKKLRKGKKGEETAEMNPKVSTDKTSTEGVKESMTIREKLLSVLEKKDNHSPNQDKAEKPEAALKGAGAIQMKADLGPMTPVLDAEKIAADDVKAVDKSSKVSPKNSTDKNAKGDKNIINKPVDVTQQGGFKESFTNLVQAMRDAGEKMYAPKVEDLEDNEFVVMEESNDDMASKHDMHWADHTKKAKEASQDGNSEHAILHRKAAEAHSQATKSYEKGSKFAARHSREAMQASQKANNFYNTDENYAG